MKNKTLCMIVSLVIALSLTGCETLSTAWGLNDTVNDVSQAPIDKQPSGIAMNIFDNFPDAEIMGTLGNPVLYHPDDVTDIEVHGAFTNPHANADADVNMLVTSPTIKCLESDLPGLTTSAKFTVNGVLYKAGAPQPDGTGMVLIELQEVLV